MWLSFLDCGSGFVYNRNWSFFKKYIFATPNEKNMNRWIVNSEMVEVDQGDVDPIALSLQVYTQQELV